MLALVSKHNAIGRWRTQHPYAFACLCGIALSALAWGFGGQVLGAGYEETKLALQDSDELSPLFWVIKFIASLVCFASGVPGGVFAPTLSIGAGFGHYVSNLAGLDESALMLLAMAGMLAATTHCPIMAFVIVVEMVDNHDMMMPLIFVSALASVISKRLLPESIYILATQMRMPRSDAANTIPPR
jgi:H+/Cl- antiporter ClcA